MRRLLPSVAALAAATTLSAQAPPEAPRGTYVDRYHGTEVADPYRWMEAMTSARTTEWVRAQDAYARRMAEAVPARGLIRERIAELYGGTRFAGPVVRGSRFFLAESGGGLVATRLLVQDGTAPARVLIDPLELDPSGAARLTRFVPSDDGRMVAYGVAVGGSSWETWYIRDVATGRDLADRLTGLHAGRSGSPDWTSDGRRIYYERFELPPSGQELSYRVRDGKLAVHVLGTDAAHDRVVFDPEPEDVFVSATRTQDGDHLVLSVSRTGAAENQVYRIDPRQPDDVRELMPEPDASYVFIGSDGPVFWFMTNLDAPNWKVIAVDITRPERTSWVDLVPEAADAMDPTIGAAGIGDKIVIGYRHHARLALKAFQPDGTPAYEIPLPGGGETWGFSGNQADPHAYYRLQSAVDPGTIYQLDLATGASRVWRAPDLPYDPRDYLTTQVFYDSRDGTRIPMFLVHHKDVELDGTNPVFLYGFGAFNWAAAPWFQPAVAVWLQMGGIYALPNIRGGGEYGERWHQAGTRRNKQNSIDDYLAAAEWLLENGYTSRDLLVGNGGSASGPLIGAAIVQRPDLFAAAVIDYPALDMLRLEAFTGGQGWRGDFGTVEDPEDYAALRAYSPYHNVEPGVCYPATIIAPGSRDESTVPMHAYKFAAALQHAQACDRPILLRVSWGAGHSAGVTPEDRMDTWADQLGFLVRVLRLDAAEALATGDR